MTDASHDQNLLFGILAQQMSFIDRDQLVAAIHAWVRDKSKPLGDILTARGILSPERERLIRELVQEHLKEHDNDVQKSLSALNGVESLRKELEDIQDDGVQKTLSVTPGSSGKLVGDATETFTIGEAVVAGNRYRILRPHAEGGLGIVSVALDEELHREVAFKELKSFHADSSHSRARFVLEAEINGGLEHPGIVPVYGLGQYADGRPFYAMRFIRGVTLKDAISTFHRAEKRGRDPGQRSLEFRKLLRRFVDVCQAVHYAHCRGVLHRDLKPSNVMLGKYGETLVVDWGLAKAEGQVPAVAGIEEPRLVPSSGSNSVPTLMGQTLGTPAFMSPEQAEGRWDLIGPVSDVYSLGATLYQLLVGRPAFDGKDSGEVLKKVRGGEFVAPCEANTSVPKPMEDICLKAMSLSQQNRYANAVDLAEDIEHWLADESVSAHRDSLLESCFRWLRHHRSWAIAAALALLAIAVVSVTATLMINAAKTRAVVARKEAVARFQQARLAVDNWLTGTSDILQYYPDVGSIRTRLLEQAAKDYETFVGAGNDDFEMQVEQGRTWLRLGDVRSRLGNVPAAQNAYEQAVSVSQGLVADNPGSLEAQIEYARALARAGGAHWRAGNHSEAESAFESALSELRKAETGPLTDPRVREMMGIALTDLALCFVDTKSRQRAESLFRQAIDELEVAQGETKDNAQASQALATTWHLLGGLLADMGRYAEASRQIHTSIEAYDELVKTDPQVLSGRADARTSLANLLRVQGRWFEERQCRDSIIVDLDLLDSAMPNSPVLSERIALAKTNRGQLLNLMGHTVEAEQELESTLQLLEDLSVEYTKRLRSPDDIPPRYWYVRAACVDALGEILRDVGRNEEARSAYMGAIDSLDFLIEQSAGNQSYQERLAVTQSHLAQLLHKLGEHEEANALFESATHTLNRLVEESPDLPVLRDELGFVLSYRGRTYFDSGDAARGAEMFSRAKATWETLIERQQPAAPQQLQNYAWFLVTCADVGMRDPNRAIELIRMAVAASEDNPSYHSTLGVALFRLEDLPAAQRAFDDAIRFRGEGNACDCYFLSMVQWKLDQKERAKESFEQGERWMEERRPENAELRQFRQEAAMLQGLE